MVEAAQDVRVRVGPDDGGHVAFGPLTPDISWSEPPTYDFLLGPITVVTASGESYHLEDRDGIEPAALAQFRTDLRSLLQEQRGRVFFGDHDFGQIVDLNIVDGMVRLRSSLPSYDLVDVEIAMLDGVDLERTLRQIDHVEATFGPLVGFCHACGRPPPSFYG